MTKSAPAPRGAPAAGLEYTLYVFPVEGSPGSGKWEKTATLTSLAEAQLQADILFRSGSYRKVEVKQKFFDKKKNRNIDVTLKVLEQGAARRKRAIGPVAVLVFAVLCGGAAFAATWYVTR